MIVVRAQERPETSVVLFDGTSMDEWESVVDGGPVKWPVKDGFVEVLPGARDIVTRRKFADCFLHLEFRCPDMPEATGQKKGNSGVFLQCRYEIQVLDSYGWKVPGKGDCGALYDMHSPLVNACRPALEWQAYDVVYRAPRFDAAGKKLENCRMTVFQNGIVVQNNADVYAPTYDRKASDAAEPMPLKLQDHGDRVAYRNIWLMPLPASGSSEYAPRN